MLAARGFPARSRRLRRYTARFAPELRDEFQRRAHARMRVHPRDAVEIARLAVIVTEHIDGPVARARALSAWAQAAMLGGDHRQALRIIRKAADLSLDAASPAAAEIETLRAQALMHLERYDQAAAAIERARAGHDMRGDRKGLLWTTLVLADLAFRRDEYRAALRLFSDAERLVQGSEMPRVRAAIASNRANALEARNRFRAAERQFAIARELFESEGCAHTVAQVDYNAAYAEGLRGRFASALRRYSAVGDRFARLGDERHGAHVDLDRAEIFVRLNMPADAGAAAEQSEATFKRLRLTKEATQACQVVARAAALGGNVALAHERWERAARSFRRLGLKERAYQCLVGRAELLRSAGDSRAAGRMASRAERARRGAWQNPVSLAAVELLRARIDLDEGRPREALRRSAAVLDACRRAHAPCARIDAERVRWRALADMGETSAAIDAYRSAIEELESYRGGVPADEHMIAFLAGRAALYREIVELLAAAGRDRSAFEFVERAKSRALADALGGRDGRRENATADGLLATRARHLRERLSAVYGRLMRRDDQGSARSARATQRALGQARSLERELTRVIRSQRLGDATRVPLAAVSAPTLAEVRETLEADTTLVEFFMTDAHLYTFVVTPTDLHVSRRPVSHAALRRLIEQLHFHLAKHERPELAAPDLVQRATRSVLSRLAAATLDDVAPHLHTRRLIIVPHGILHHVPFHALPWGDAYVTDRFEVLYAPSAAVYRFCGLQRDRARGAPAILALPDEVAPAIENEARSLSERLGTNRVFVGDAATFDRLATEVRRARIVHIATHGMFRPDQPMLSSMRLADRWASLFDLDRLHVRSELIVLSCCESGTADVSGGDEIVGLTRGFLCAGAPALLASQWRVDDAVTTAFMTRFYGELERRGDAAEAHRAAMAAIRAQHPHPYYWAPFFLTGRPVKSRPRPHGATTGQGCAQRSAGFVSGCRGRKEHV